MEKMKSKLCSDPKMSDLFVQDVLRITGLEYNDEGYLLDLEEDPLDPDYIIIKGKVLRYANAGILHSQDLIFDPYNMPYVMDELFRRYLERCHQDVVSTQILAYSQRGLPKLDSYGYLTILYGDGSKIQTKPHYKDSTKYLEAFMRLEAMTDNDIKEVIDKYDEYETEYFKNNPNKRR